MGAGVERVGPAHGNCGGHGNQVINCPTSNSLTATIADMTLQPVTYAAALRRAQEQSTLTAAELGCAGQGWNVTVQASDWARTNGGPVIPADAFTLTQVANPAAFSGQGINALGGPKLVNNVGTLNLSQSPASQCRLRPWFVLAGVRRQAHDSCHRAARHVQGGGDHYDFDQPLALPCAV